MRITSATLKTGITKVQALGTNPRTTPPRTKALASLTLLKARKEPRSTNADPPQSVGNQKKRGAGSPRRAMTPRNPAKRTRLPPRRQELDQTYAERTFASHDHRPERGKRRNIAELPTDFHLIARALAFAVHSRLSGKNGPAEMQKSSGRQTRRPICCGVALVSHAHRPEPKLRPTKF